MLIVVVLGVVLLLVAVLAATVPRLDRLVARRAERAAGDYLAAPFGGADAGVTVRVRDRPFLPQALRGCYRDVEVLGTLRAGRLAGATLVAHLTGVRLSTRELLAGRVVELPCERVQGRMLVPYEQLARAAPIPGLRLRFEGERLLASAALPVPGVGPFASVTGEALLTRAASGTVWLRLRGVSVAGLVVPSAVLGQLLPALSVPVTLPQLPYGLHIDDVRPSAAGLVVDGSATAVVFSASREADGWRVADDGRYARGHG